MKRSPLVFRICTLMVLVAAVVSLGQAQNREKFGISAKAGGVNAVSGRVLVKRASQIPQLLTSQDNLEPGDIVKTGDDSQVEVLLNPGSYFRVSENSEFTFVSNSLDSLLVKLIRGSAIIEATGPDDTGMRINVDTDQRRLVIVRSGIYRINAQPGKTELLVRKGRVMLGPEARDLVKGGKRIEFGGGVEQLLKIGKQDQDEFDIWSKERGQTLARANQRLSYRSLSQSLFDARWDWAFSAANPYGLWAWSSYSRCFTFMPFYYGWSSPYGHYYGSYYNLFPGRGCCNGNGSIVDTHSNGSNPGSYGGSSGGSSGGSGGGSGGSRGPSGPSFPSAPGPSAPSQAGPRDPDSGSRRVPKIDN